MREQQRLEAQGRAAEAEQARLARLAGEAAAAEARRAAEEAYLAALRAEAEARLEAARRARREAWVGVPAHWRHHEEGLRLVDDLGSVDRFRAWMTASLEHPAGCGGGVALRGLRVVRVLRVENGALWRRYDGQVGF